MQTLKSIGQRIRALRQDRRETQAVVAEAVGLERASRSMLETGKDRPGLQTLRALADYFGVTLDYLESGTPLPRVEMPADADQSIEEAEMLTIWRKIGKPHQAAVVTLMEQLAGLADPNELTGHVSPPKNKPRRNS